MTIRGSFIQPVSERILAEEKSDIRKMKTRSLTDTKVISGIDKVATTTEEKRVARTAGILFIIATLASLLSTPFLANINSSNYLADLSTNGSSLMVGVLFVIVGAAASASIAISLYPVLRRYHQGLALGAVGFRLIEGVLYFVGAIAIVSLLTLSQEFIKAGAPLSSYFQTLGILLLAQYHWVTFAAAPLVFGLGALLYYFIFHQTKLIPRWLSDWGIAGAALCIVSSLLAMFSLIGPFSTIQVVINLPIAVQEMALAVWLIAKGFQNTGNLT
jgi:Domain of unknown function (DUF4386)